MAFMALAFIARIALAQAAQVQAWLAQVTFWVLRKMAKAMRAMKAKAMKAMRRKAKKAAAEDAAPKKAMRRRAANSVNGHKLPSGHDTLYDRALLGPCVLGLDLTCLRALPIGRAFSFDPARQGLR